MSTITSQTDYLDVAVPAASEAIRPSRRAMLLILGGCAVMFLFMHFGLTWLYGRVDETWARIGVAAVMVVMAAFFERALLPTSPGPVVRALGYGRGNPRAVLVAVIISLLMLAFFPIFTAVTGVPITLKSDWLWLMVGIAAVQGVAEETLFRGYVFGNLRRMGHSFRRAGFMSMAVFAAVHLVLFTQFDLMIAGLSTLLAITIAFPMATLFERGRNTIWAAAILHTTTSAIRVVDVPEPMYMTVVVIWFAIQIVMPFLVYAFRGNLLKKAA